MRTATTLPRHLALAALALGALGGCVEGPRIEARPQVITFAPAPTPAVNQSSAVVSATASSGLPVLYASRTPSTCSVDAGGVVAAAAAGTCTIAATQAGDSRYAAAPQVTQDVTFTFRGVIEFAPAPSMSLYDLATVSAVESTGLPVGFASATPSTCAVEDATGVVSALAAGDCTIVASAGDGQASLTIAVTAPPGAAAPGAPTRLSATAGEAPGTVTVTVGAVVAGGSPITGYTVTSSPPGVTGSGPSSPVTAACPGTCAGFAITVAATNDLGTSLPSVPVDVVSRYRVLTTFREPDTQPNDSIFEGTFTFNATAGVASGLQGRLSESMTGGATPYPDDSMTWLTLGHQRSSLPAVLDGAPGLLVTTFLLETTDTLAQEPKFGGTDGWEPGTGMGLHFGFPGANPGNAYVRIWVNAAEPTAAPTQGQLDKLAYADCAPGGMMGASCMTGTTEAGYGSIGTMGGRPVSQVTTRR
ncbi:MAG: hypothetical protein IPO09_05990 [Anaeromyxobacter sp.]|nr:hypothetical protein [Anaeromyxobacter sp.]